MTTLTQKLKDHSTELRDEQLSKNCYLGHAHGFMVTANADGSIPLNSKVIARIEPGAGEAIAEIEHRANSYPRLVEALRRLLNGEFGNVSLKKMQERGGGSYWTTAATLLRDLGESE